MIKTRIKKTIVLLLTFTICIGTLCSNAFAVTVDKDHPAVIAPYNEVYHPYCLSLFESQNNYANAVITQENNLWDLKQQLAALQDSSILGVKVALMDAASLCILSIGLPLTCGGIASLDAVATATLLSDIQGIYSDNKTIQDIKAKMITVNSNLQTAVNNYNALTSSLQTYLQKYGTAVFNCAGYLSPTVNVFWTHLEYKGGEF